MKYIEADLLNDVVSSYDQTKTTIQGRVTQKTIGGELVLGPPVTKFIDVFSDTGQIPTATIRVTEHNRLFVCGAPTAGNIPIMLYDFNLTTGVSAYVGRINVTMPNVAATTHTIRSLRVVNDSGATGWKLFLTTTATVAINSGTFLINKIDKADFTPGGTTILLATGNDVKGNYLLQDPANIGVGQLQIASVGSSYIPSLNRLVVHNGVAAVHQFYLYDTATAPTYVTNTVNVSVGAPGVVTDTGHTFVVNTPVVFTSGPLPTGLTVGTIYFVRNPVAGVSYELSATSGGASITTTGSPATGVTIGRAFGTSSNLFVHKTGNLPVLTGTLLNTDSEEYAIPISSPINGGVLDGNDCIFFATASNLYLGLVSQLTSGATAWPSLSTSNILGTVNEITAPTATFATWSNVIDQATYVTNVSKFISKKLENNVIKSITGELNNRYYEGFSFDTVSLGLATVIALTDRDGWIFAASSTVGQRGVIASDFRSDYASDYSYIVTKVLSNQNSKLTFYTTYEKLFDQTGNIKLQYRNSGFNSISGGWIDVPAFTALQSLVITSDEIQFKILFNMQSEGSSSPAQVNELLVGVDANNGISDNWEFSDDFSDNGVPSRTAFRLKLAYSSTVPTLYYRAYDLSNALLINNNTVTNTVNFEYSTDGGTSWNALGTIPNVVGTLVRYSFTSPPGVDIRPGLKES
jgi:hypothetical protein